MLDTRRAKRHRGSTDRLRPGRPVISGAGTEASSELAMLWRRAGDRDGRGTIGCRRSSAKELTGMSCFASRDRRLTCGNLKLKREDKAVIPEAVKKLQKVIDASMPSIRIAV
jgi:hypothetical protein